MLETRSRENLAILSRLKGGCQRENRIFGTVDHTADYYCVSTLFQAIQWKKYLRPGEVRIFRRDQNFSLGHLSLSLP